MFAIRNQKFFHITLKKIIQYRAIAVCKKDKDVGKVILNREEYYKKLSSIVDDSEKFKVQDYDIYGSKVKVWYSAPWIKQEKMVIYYCNKYIKKKVSEAEYNCKNPTGSQPGKLYGMAKDRKPNCPLRPVLSTINTPEYGLAKWLERQLKSLLEDKYSTL